MRRLTLCLMAATMAILGCDRKPRVVEKDDAPPSATTKPAGDPTIASAKRVNQQLGRYPLRMDIPEPWKVNSKSELATVVSGKTPTSMVAVVAYVMTDPRVATSTTPYLMSDEQVKVAMTTATEGLAKEPDRFKAVERRREGPVEVLDTIMSTAPTTSPTARPASMRRTISLYVPVGDRFAYYQVSYEQPAPQFEADRTFMQSILSTLTYDPSLDTMPRTPPATRPSDEWRRPSDFRNEK